MSWETIYKASWQSIDHKHRKKYGRSFVACDERYERDFIVSLIKETLPFYARLDIEKAVDDCCISIEAPRSKEVFWQCVKSKLQDE